MCLLFKHQKAAHQDFHSTEPFTTLIHLILTLVYA